MFHQTSFTQASGYLFFYRYLLVLTEAQLLKLRNIALGLLTPAAFSPEEISDLEQKVQALENGA